MVDLNKLDELINNVTEDSKKDDLFIATLVSLETLRETIIPSGMNIIDHYIKSIISSLDIVDLVSNNKGKERTDYYRSELTKLL